MKQGVELKPSRKHDALLRPVFAAAVYCLLLVAPVNADLRDYDTKYYVIHSDIDPDDVKEAAIRMTKMAEEYHERTKGFAGTIRTKFPFFLFKSASDYYARGGLPGSAGVFMVDESGSRLMAIAGKKPSAETWHTVQHEGFHQFAHAVIGGKIPVWLNEGLAEYFGEGIFTGDGFVTGVVPPWRLARVKEEIEGHEFKAIKNIMKVSDDEWAAEMDIRNYDQAWSMVHFLVHGDDGKYQAAFSSCIRGISQGRSFDRAWLDSIGPADGFQDRWKQYWSSQPENPTSLLFDRATVATLTSFLARATAQRQTFADFEAFRTSAEADDLRINPDDWLPHALLSATLRELSPVRHPELHAGDNKLPVISLELTDGTRLTGWFTLRGPRIDQVFVDIDDLPKVLKTATESVEKGGKKGDARLVVQAALKQHPKSPASAAAKKFLLTVK